MTDIKTDLPTDLTAATEPTKHYVLLMTAAVIACDAMNEMDAAQQALLAGPQVLDPKQLQWVVKFVDTKPIYLGEGDEEEALVEEPEAAPSKIQLIQ
jgi:hypothetical protein